MEEFLNYVIKRLVDYPEEVIISQSQENRKVTFFVKLQPDDVGKVIGRNGHVIGSIRKIVNASASKHGQRANIEIVEG